VGVQVKQCEIPWEHVPYLGASAVVIHYKCMHLYLYLLRCWPVATAYFSQTTAHRVWLTFAHSASGPFVNNWTTFYASHEIRAVIEARHNGARLHTGNNAVWVACGDWIWLYRANSPNIKLHIVILYLCSTEHAGS